MFCFCPEVACPEFVDSGFEGLGVVPVLTTLPVTGFEDPVSPESGSPVPCFCTPDVAAAVPVAPVDVEGFSAAVALWPGAPGFSVLEPGVAVPCVVVAGGLSGTDGSLRVKTSTARTGPATSLGEGDLSSTLVTTRISSSLLRFAAGRSRISRKASLPGATFETAPTSSPLGKIWSPR